MSFRYRAASECPGIWAVSADNGPLSRDLSRICGRWPVVSGSELYLRTLAPLSRDLGCICGRWPSVSGSGLYLRTLAHCLGIWAVSADAGPASRDLGCICGRWPIVPGSGPYLRTLAHCPGIWAVSAYAGPLSRDLRRICGQWPRHGSPRNRIRIRIRIGTRQDPCWRTAPKGRRPVAWGESPR